MQKNRRDRTLTLLFLCVTLLFFLCVLYISEGENGLSWGDLTSTDERAALLRLIAIEVRLPRLLCAAAVGALLSISGTIMQALFRNPLVEPYTIGVSGGAVMGVAIAFAIGAVDIGGNLALSGSAAAGALSTMVIVLLMRRSMGYDTDTMLLCGIMISFITSAITTILMCFGTRENISQVIAWTIGSFEAMEPTTAYTTVIIALSVAFVSPLAGNTLNVISLGDDEAQSLGLSQKQTVLLLFTIATLLAALSVAAAGIVAFIGMMVPHITRSIFGHDNRLTLPAAGLCGAILLIGCDLIGKTILYPREMPAGAISAILGGITFICLTIQWKKKCNKS